MLKYQKFKVQDKTGGMGTIYHRWQQLSILNTAIIAAAMISIFGIVLIAAAMTHKHENSTP